MCIRDSNPNRYSPRTQFDGETLARRLDIDALYTPPSSGKRDYSSQEVFTAGDAFGLLKEVEQFSSCPTYLLQARVRPMARATARASVSVCVGVRVSLRVRVRARVAVGAQGPIAAGALGPNPNPTLT